MRKLVLPFLLTILVINISNVWGQTTVTYAQQTTNYYAEFADGGDNFNQGSYQVGMWAHNGNKQVVNWRKFRTDASGNSSSDRALQVGDEFLINLSATRAFGRIGFALLASPTSTSNWGDRENNYALSVNLDGPTYTGSGYGVWYIKYAGGATSAAGFGGDQTNYKGVTFWLKLTAVDRINVRIFDGTTNSYFYDVQLNTSNPITDYSIFLQDDYNGGSNRDIFWGHGSENTQGTLQNTKTITIGSSDASFTISSAIADGLEANSSSVSSTNNLIKAGSGTVTFSNANTYTGTTTVSAGILEIQGDMSSSLITVENGATLRINGNDVDINALTINSGGIVEILSGKSLTVNGTLTNTSNTGLVIQSGGSLIQSSASVSATAERDITAWIDAAHGWHFLSSPVTTQAIASEFTDPTLANYDFFAWWEPTNQWVSYQNTTVVPVWNTANVLGGTSGAGNFIPGKGYLVAYSATDTKQFTGTLNKDNISISDLAISTGAENNYGWHLLGNPFTSALTWGTANWSLTHINSTAKIWKESTAAFVDITGGSGIIPALNGFLVQVTATFGGNNSLTIPTADRVHDATAWYKSSENQTIKLVANDLAGQTAQESVVRFNPEATSGFDPAFDSHFFAGYAPQFYSVSTNEKLSTNSLPGFNSETVIPFRFIKNEGTNFVIEATGIETLETSSSVYLRDNKLGINFNLSENPVYAFSSAEGDNPDRFELKFGTVGINDTPTTQTVVAYYNAGSLYISAVEGTTNIGIYNIQGQNLMNRELHGSALQNLTLNLPTGVYFARIVNDGKMQTVKIIAQ